MQPDMPGFKICRNYGVSHMVAHIVVVPEEQHIDFGRQMCNTLSRTVSARGQLPKLPRNQSFLLLPESILTQFTQFVL